MEEKVEMRLEELVEDNVATFTGVFTSECHIIHPLFGLLEYTARYRFEEHRSAETGPDYYYVRATEKNGHLAWSSPIWV